MGVEGNRGGVKGMKGVVRGITADGGDIDHAVAEFDEGTPVDVHPEYRH